MSRDVFVTDLAAKQRIGTKILTIGHRCRNVSIERDMLRPDGNMRRPLIDRHVYRRTANQRAINSHHTHRWRSNETRCK